MKSFTLKQKVQIAYTKFILALHLSDLFRLNMRKWQAFDAAYSGTDRQ